MTAADRIATAVVGCGYWGTNLARNFAALSDLRICCDPSEDVRRRMGAQYPHARVTADYAEVLDDPGIDAIVLATPAPTHADLAVRALAAGKHLFVEKPLALNEADARRVIDAAERAGRILAVGHLLEYHPAVEYLKDLVQGGDLGEVYYCYSHRLNLGKLRSDENALWSLAPHDISVVLYLLGEEPTSVEARGQAFLQPGIEDVCFVTLRFASGRVAHIHVSWLDPHKTRQLTVVGSKKMAVFDDMEPREKVRIYDKGVDRGDRPEVPGYPDVLTIREGNILIPQLPSHEPLALECKEFLNAVATGKPPRSDGADGLRVVRVLQQAQEMLEREVVTYRRGSR